MLKQRQGYFARTYGHLLDNPQETTIYTKYKYDQPKIMNNLSAGKGFSLPLVLLTFVIGKFIGFRYNSKFLLIDIGFLMFCLTYSLILRPLILNGVIGIKFKEQETGSLPKLLITLSALMYASIVRLIFVIVFACGIWVDTNIFDFTILRFLGSRIADMASSIYSLSINIPELLIVSGIMVASLSLTLIVLLNLRKGTLLTKSAREIDKPVISTNYEERKEDDSSVSIDEIMQKIEEKQKREASDRQKSNYQREHSRPIQKLQFEKIEFKEVQIEKKPEKEIKVKTEETKTTKKNEESSTIGVRRRGRY